MNSVIKAKLKRLHRGDSPRVLDLFAGCGGLSLGFTTAGFSSLGAVEIDDHAARSHGMNFFDGDPLHSVARSANEEPEQLLTELCTFRGRERVETKVDMLIGGPPCQAFARVGRAKLRAEARRVLAPNSERAYLDDERVSLYQRYLLYVECFKPVALVMENVPDILNHGGENVAEVVANHLEDLGYRVSYRLLNSSNYGVPQIRERMILQAIHEEAECDVLWPKPTHYCELPSGYHGTRATALKNIRSPDQTSLHPRETHYAFIEELDTIDEQGKDVYLPATATREAIGDLPEIYTMDKEQKPLTEGGPRDLTVPVQPRKAHSGYAKLMQSWPGFEGNGQTTAHVIRHLTRDYKIFRQMKHGWEYPQIHAWVEAKREAIIQERYERGLNTQPSHPEMQEIIKAWTIPYDPSKFPNKWWKLIPHKPSRTLLAHLGKDSYSHIHYDCTQARTISVREAARLQSFPDGFRFAGSMNPGFKQIGNAVPPLFAYSLAMSIREALDLPVIPDIRHTVMGVPKRHLGSMYCDEASACIS
jgi:DNA (cytosine-5)-methyltransferase 1